MTNLSQLDLEPIAAYDRAAPYFGSVRARSLAYLSAVDELIVRNFPDGARSMLDVGSGEGERAEMIAARCAISELVLLEPSSGMRQFIRSGREVWTSRIEDLPAKDRTFDAITCLWNVLGHITSPERRLRALRNMRALLAPDGLLFLDVQNRYNARHYGAAKTGARIMYDRLRSSPRNGDVTVRWPVNGGVSLYGHVFTRGEMLGLFSGAGVKIRKSLFIDYATGAMRSSQFAGSMFFVLSR